MSCGALCETPFSFTFATVTPVVGRPLTLIVPGYGEVTFTKKSVIVIVLPFALLTVVLGDEAESPVLPPLQIVAEVGVIVGAVGTAFTVMVTLLEEAEQGELLIVHAST